VLRLRKDIECESILNPKTFTKNIKISFEGYPPDIAQRWQVAGDLVP